MRVFIVVSIISLIACSKPNNIIEYYPCEFSKQHSGVLTDSTMENWAYSGINQSTLDSITALFDDQGNTHIVVVQFGRHIENRIIIRDVSVNKNYYLKAINGQYDLIQVMEVNGFIESELDEIDNSIMRCEKGSNRHLDVRDGYPLWYIKQGRNKSIIIDYTSRDTTNVGILVKKLVSEFDYDQKFKD